MNLNKFVYFFIVLFSISTYAQEIAGKWYGILKVPSRDLSIVININKIENEYKSTLDSPDQNSKSITVTNTSFENSILKFEISNIKIEYQGTLQNDNTITGIFKQSGKTFILNFLREEPKKQKSLGQYLNIKSMDIDLKGTILIPENDKIKKLVVFVNGSGSSDRDEFVFAYRPFKDIAESLYAKQIASYRFDKRTFSNPKSLNDKSTIDDETTNDIINVVNYFKKDSLFSDYEIIILGHSFGANIMPKISNKSDRINKIILLAGNARPLTNLLVEQYEYLYKLTPTQELKDILQKTKEQVIFLNSKSFNLNTPKEKLPFNLSSYYWKSVLEYNPIKEIQKVKVPILILQGERDYQVTIKDFELWKNALKNNKNATFIKYPKLNHFFVSGEGLPNPNEYNTKGNVDLKVIEDIFNFIIKT